MDFEQGLLTRRSVRRFKKNRSIPNQTLQEILNIAMHAPSARDSQCWEFIIVDDKKKFEKFIEIHSGASHIKDASAVVIVCGNQKKQVSTHSWVVDASSATLQLSLAAHAKGLGSCICGIFPSKEMMLKVSQLVDLPHSVEPLSMVILGYKQEEPKQPINRYDVNKIHMNTW